MGLDYGMVNENMIFLVLVALRQKSLRLIFIKVNTHFRVLCIIVLFVRSS